MNPLMKLIEQRKAGKPVGIASCCSANEYVLRAVLRHSKRNGIPVLIEATANQVNQYGGYTGMKPKDFFDYVMDLTAQEGVDAGNVILGGDHLGPLVWRSEDADTAMQKAEELVAAYVAAGFTKIHLDTSMPLGGKTTEDEFGNALIARRSARLCNVAERAWETAGLSERPVYVIGSEVPIPGGAVAEESVAVTEPEAFLSEMGLFRQTYLSAGLDFSRVIAFVVQPGVEFTNESAHLYDRDRAQRLMRAKEAFTDMVFEGHSTDYQPQERLRAMVEDGVAILKVGPALTFAMREGLYALESIAREICPEDAPAFRGTLMEAMIANPQHWKSHYVGSEQEIAYQLSYGLSDRCRYYMSEPRVKREAESLLSFFEGKEIPYALLRQYMPVQAARVREGELQKEAKSLLYDKIDETLNDYLYAARPIDCGCD